MSIKTLFIGVNIFCIGHKGIFVDRKQLFQVLKYTSSIVLERHFLIRCETPVSNRSGHPIYKHLSLTKTTHRSQKSNKDHLLTR